MTDSAPILVWFRLDLRLADNPALTAAVVRGRPVIPVFILDDADAGDRAIGGASRWWLHGSLQALSTDLAAKHTRVVLRQGAAREQLDRLITETGADAVFWNRRYEPWATARDQTLKTTLESRGIEVRSFNAGLLYEPWQVTSKQDTPLKVFTPFWRALLAKGSPAEPLPAPASIPTPHTWPDSEPLETWTLRPSQPDWAGGLRANWIPGEQAARKRLIDFLDGPVFNYGDTRNRPGTPGTSRLSPHLHFGEISPRQIWHATRMKSEAETGQSMAAGVEVYLKEIVWREFSYNLLFHMPDLPVTSLKPAFENFPWRQDESTFKAWQRGRTGYPIVDAGMRELWCTGWMHNRVRMIVASFLIKHLMVHWRHGEAWFWDTLVDADLASNAASWQWVAGSGADAAPFFRIFNPILQGEKFDPEGDYIRRWVPELTGLPNVLIHQPWTARPLDLAEAGIQLGYDYPGPIVDHKAARNRALAAYKNLNKA